MFAGFVDQCVFIDPTDPSGIRFKSAFMPYAQKARMLREVNLEIDGIFMQEYPDDYDRRLTSL